MSESNTFKTPRDVFEQRLAYPWEHTIASWFGTHTVLLHDHLGGFDKNFKNEILNKIPPGVTVRTEYLLNQQIKEQYPFLNIKFDSTLMIFNNHFSSFVNYSILKTQSIENFLCAFFRTNYTGRVWLLCWLHELGWFDLNYGSKNFVIDQYPLEVKNLYRSKIGNDFDDPTKQIQRQQMQNALSFLGENETRNQHKINLNSISNKIQKSFVCIVAETHPTHHCPFPTEKFLYPIVNHTLWVAYAQPGYHDFIKRYLGFRLYDCFDYSFDAVTDHVERMVAMTDMLQKFSTMSRDQWKQVYHSQKQIIDYNAEHVRSGNFIKFLEQFDEIK